MANPVQRPIGTRDFAPDEMAARNALAARIREVFRRFGYREVATPAFEELALFAAKSGDGIVSELYHFKDKGDRDLTLRPELTAPVMRMYFQDHFNDPKPLKWFYFGSCYRYDRPQAGRYREFWQFGCEEIGAGTPLAYAELMALADAVLREAGLKEREFHVGHVGILKHCVDAFGFDVKARGELMRAIDKRDDGKVRELARTRKGCEAALDRLFLVMEAPTLAAARNALQVDLAGSDAEDRALVAAVAELEEALRHLGSFGVQDVRLNLGIARGLDYYTGIVFEVHSPVLGAQKQLLGGGGYDLSAVFGGASTPTMGFGLGFDRTLVALEKQGTPLPRAEGPQLHLAALSEKAQPVVLKAASELRRTGVSVDLDLLGRKPGAVAKHADAVGARFVAMVGDRDLQAGTVEVKELATGKAERVALADLGRALASG